MNKALPVTTNMIHHQKLVHNIDDNSWKWFCFLLATPFCNTFRLMSIYIISISYVCKYFVRNSITMIYYFDLDNDISFKIYEKYHSYF